jgi:DNA-binding transcriptional ArsR family regulator
MYGEEDEKITLDKKTFKTLASDTRIGILKSLGRRRKTLSELSKEHKMSVSTVKEHLDNLVGAELIIQIDDGHKWKYYELTRKGKAVLNPEEKKIWILLSLSLLAIVAAASDAVSGVISRLFLTFGSNAARTPPVLGSGQDMMTAPQAQAVEEAAKAAANASDSMVGSGTGAELIAEAGADAALNAQAAAPIPWLHLAIIIAFVLLAAYFAFRLLRNRKRGKKSSN